jgi:hypothetical protein
MVPRPHALERGHGAVDEAQIGDLRDPFEVVRAELVEWREDGGHRVVYPDINRPERILGALGRVFGRSRVGHVARYRHGLAPE